VADEKGALAEQRVPLHVAEVLEQDATDEPDVQPREQCQITQAHHVIDGQHADQVRKGDVARR
jgi:hypothetical protein